MLTARPAAPTSSGAPARLLLVGPRHPGDAVAVAPAGADPDRAPAVALPGGPGELADRLEELLDDATDPEAWEAVLAGAAAHAGDARLATAVARLVGRAREVHGRGVGGVWYLDPEHDAARLVLAAAGRPVSGRAPTWGFADHRRRRVDEVLAVLAAGTPVHLLATPTETDGRLSPGVLAERLGADSHGAGSGDRRQARLRIPQASLAPTQWQVRGERTRQGTSITLVESPAPTTGDVVDLRDGAADGRSRAWDGLGRRVTGSAHREPTREADLLRWASPNETDRFDAWAAERLARNVDWWEADWEERRLFTRLRTTHVAPGLPGRVLLAVGLATKQPTAHQPAVAVTRRLFDADLLRPVDLGATVAELAAVLDPARLAMTLGAIRHTNPTEVAAVLDQALPAFSPADRRVADLVTTYVDVTSGRSIPLRSPATRAWLSAASGTDAVGMAAAAALSGWSP